MSGNRNFLMKQGLTNSVMPDYGTLASVKTVKSVKGYCTSYSCCNFQQEVFEKRINRFRTRTHLKKRVLKVTDTYKSINECPDCTSSLYWE